MTPCLMCPSCEAAHALARRSANAAVQCARELGAVASAEVAARDALAAVAAELLAATLARDEADAAHTNAGGTAARQRTMAAALLARGRYTDAVAAALVMLGGTTDRAEVPRG